MRRGRELACKICQDRNSIHRAGTFRKKTRSGDILSGSGWGRSEGPGQGIAPLRTLADVLFQPEGCLFRTKADILLLGEFRSQERASHHVHLHV